MENSRFTFSIFVGISILIFGAFIVIKSSIGIALMLLGIILIGLTVITRHIQVEDDLQAALLPIQTPKQ